MAASPHRSHVHPHRGNALPFSVVTIAVVGLLALAGWWIFGRLGGEEGQEFIVNTVTNGPYDFVVIEQGTVESGTNTELRCEVRSRSGGGGGGGSSSGMGGGCTTIINVVPEGTIVQAGDIVVWLDSSFLEIEESNQKVKVNSQKSLVTQAKNALKAAEIAKKEYLEGTYVQEHKAIEAEKFGAEQAVRTAKANLDAAKALMEKGITTNTQVDAADFGYRQALKQLEVVETKLKTLEIHTKEKNLTTFDSDIASAKAKLDEQISNLQLEETKLTDIQDQITKCTIKAPREGQVVYANEYDSWRGSSNNQFVVAPGVSVRERQVIIRLPNANDMQVKATVNEARVTLVRPGLPVTIRVDALKDEILHGEVTKVNPYPEPGGFSTGNIKKYATLIKILEPPPGLRSGMNAEVRIHVERKQDALQVPVQALAEYKGHFFSLVKNGSRYETREVFINSTNDKVATIEKGLQKGDIVVMNPRAAGDLLVLPNLPDPVPAKMGDIARIDGSPITLAVTNPGIAAPAPAGEKGKGKGKAPLSAATMLERYLEGDTDGDGALSKEELAALDDRRQQALADADTDGDGILTRIELTKAAAANFQKRERAGGGEGGGRGAARGEGPGGFGGPAGGGE
jgi:HlyD family secretion protein